MLWGLDRLHFLEHGYLIVPVPFVKAILSLLNCLYTSIGNQLTIYV